MEVWPERITPSTGMVSPGKMRILSPTRTCSAGTIFSPSPSTTRAVRGVRWTSFSIPALALDTVSSSSRAPSCMINATSPAAKSSPMHTDATRARETSTSALMSKAVTRPMMASRMMGSPHRIMAIQAASKGSGSKSNRLTISDRPPRTRQRMSLVVPPHSSTASSFSMTFCVITYLLFIPIGVWVHYTHRGICLSTQKKKTASWAVFHKKYQILANRSTALVKFSMV